MRQGIKEWVGLKIRDPMLRPFAVIMKSADTCNYVCSYCYVEPHSAVPIMPIGTAEVAISKILEFVGKGRKVSTIWHGGEPLMAGHGFFKRIADLCEDAGDIDIENTIQTNGSFLNWDFLRFCKERHFSVSLSIDGPKDLHDMFRKDRRDGGTHDRTMEMMKLIGDAGLARGCVAVLHKQNLNRIDDIYDFFRTHEINFRINPIVRSGRAANIYNSLAIEPDEYGRAMCRLFDLWFDDVGVIQVEPLHTILGNFISPTVWGCDYAGDCVRSIISVNPDGNVYPCGRFAGLEQFRLGNILRCKDLAELFVTGTFDRLNRRSVKTVEGCLQCEFAEICNAGCMVTAHMARGNIYDRDYYCSGRKMLFEHMAVRLKEHLDGIELNA